MNTLAPGALWIAPEWSMLPLAAQRCRVRNPVNGAVAELSREQYAVLTACEGCASLEQHHAAILHKLQVRYEHRATILHWLQAFAAQRLLVPLDELIGRLGTDSIEPAPFAGVFVRTCDRPKLLARVLASAAHVERHHGARYRYTVLDDSRDDAHRAANRDAVERSGLDAQHVDLAERTTLERDLRAAMPDAARELEWIFGAAAPGEATYGRPVNVALLLAAGQRLLFLDDDAVVEPRRAPHFEPGLAVSSEADDLTAFADWAALETACLPVDLDPFESHLDRLGQPVWTQLDQAATAALVTTSDTHRFVPGARVLFTQNGALGDPGSSLFPYHLLALSDRSMMRNPGAKAAFEHRIDWRGHDRLRLAPSRTLTFTTLAGLDNTVLLPPTGRTHRNEDLLLGEMAQHIHCGAWFVDLPWALPHRREPQKRWLGPADKFGQEPVHFLLDYLSDRVASIVSDGPEQRLAAIASQLVDLSHASDARFAELLEAHVADTSTRVLFAICNRLDDARTPPAWKDALRPWLTSPAVATDPASIRARVVPMVAVRDLVARYADVLSVWPSVWQYAGQVR